MFVGDADGENGKTILSLRDFQTVGWLGDNYVLLSKQSGELYPTGYGN